MCIIHPKQTLPSEEGEYLYSTQVTARSLNLQKLDLGPCIPLRNNTGSE